jgi:hypothetical protein
MSAFFANPYPFAPLLLKRGEDGAIAFALGADAAVAAFTITADADWLSIAPDSGAIAPSETVAVTISAATAALNPGAYLATITIHDVAEDLDDLVLTVTLTVTPRLLADLRLAVKDRIQDGANKLQDLEGCLLEALRGRYSKARPLVLTVDIAGDSETWSWKLHGAGNFPGFTPGFSIIRSVEYPVGSRVPALLDSDEWITAYGELRLVDTTPATGQTMRVEYTALHAEDGSTVPDGDFDGLANLAASLACQRLQAIFTQAGNSSIGADVVQQSDKARGYADLAKQYEERFKEAFGLDQEEQQPAASSTISWEDKPGGLGRLTH